MLQILNSHSLFLFSAVNRARELRLWIYKSIIKSIHGGSVLSMAADKIFSEKGHAGYRDMDVMSPPDVHYGKSFVTPDRPVSYSRARVLLYHGNGFVRHCRIPGRISDYPEKAGSYLCVDACFLGGFFVSVA